MIKLTKRQKEILSFVDDWMEKGDIPSFDDIAKHFGFTNNAARDHINALSEKGCLSLDLFRKRGIKEPAKDSKVMRNATVDRLAHKPTIAKTPRDLVEIPFYSTIENCHPYLVDKNISEVLAVSYDKVKFIVEECFAFECFTDSVSGIGIRERDTVIGLSVNVANSNDIVLVNVKGQNIFRQIFYCGTHVILFSDTAGVDPVQYPVGEVNIICKCIGVYRWMKI